MLDPAILLSLQVPFPPEQPTLAQEQVLQSTAGVQAERIGRRLADSFDAAADAWLAAMARTRISAEHATIESSTTDIDLRALTGLIADFETLADVRARQSARTNRRIARTVKAAFETDPSAAAAHRAFGDRIVATEKRVVEALLEYALFLRAVRAEIDPASRRGPTFDDAADLERYLIGAA